MKRFDSIILKIYVYLFPLFIIAAIFGYLYISKGFDNQTNVFLNFLNNLTGIIILSWMVLSLYLSVRLMVSGPFRDQVITKLTFIRERDEREVLLTGKATRTTFMTSLAILIFLLCLSLFQISVYRVPPEKAVNGKTGTISLGLSFNPFQNSNQAISKDIIEKTDIVSYTGLPISNATVIMILILWQIISYNYSMRRLTKGKMG
jgi:hypothetical protein